MDSVIDHVHWSKSSLTVFADEWIGDPTPQEFIAIPEAEEFNFDVNLEIQLNQKDNKKRQKAEWKPNPMEVWTIPYTTLIRRNVSLEVLKRIMYE